MDGMDLHEAKNPWLGAELPNGLFLIIYTCHGPKLINISVLGLNML